MTADVLFDPSFPHGTPGGFAKCKGSRCPAPIACRDVHRRYAGDFRFARRYDAGMSLKDILQAEKDDARAAKRAARPPRPAPKPRKRNRIKRAPLGVDRAPTTDHQHDVARLHAEGLTDRQIGDRLGRDRNAVRQIRVLLNLPLNAEPKTSDRVRELHAQGNDDATIARLLDKEREYVGHLRRKLGLPRIPAPRSDVANADIRRLHQQGMSDQEIADELGTERAVIRKRRHNLKLAINKPPVQPGASSSQE